MMTPAPVKGTELRIPLTPIGTLAPRISTAATFFPFPSCRTFHKCMGLLPLASRLGQRLGIHRDCQLQDRAPDQCGSRVRHGLFRRRI